MKTAGSAGRKFAALLGFCATGLVVASPSWAAVTTVDARGDWTLATGTDESGTRVCAAATSGTQIYMGVKIYENSKNITIHVAKSNWQIPNGTRLRILFHFDYATPWSGLAYSTRHASLLETSLPLASVKGFMGQFARAERLIIGFPDGNEQPWRISMRGSRYIIGGLAQCVARLAATQGPSQPYSPDQPTQPFNNVPAPPPAPPTPQPPAPAPRSPAEQLPTGERI